MQFEFLGHPIDGVTFDLEGTIINLELQHHSAHAEVARRFFGLELDIKDPQLFIDVPHMIGGPDRLVMQDLISLAETRNLLKGGKPDIEEMLGLDKEAYHALLNQLGPEFFQPRPGFTNLFHQLHQYGIPIAIGTLTEANDAFLLLAKSGLAERFRSFNLFTFEDVQHTKPDPEVYRMTAGMLRISPYRQLVFEDSHNGIISAREAGSVPVGMPVYRNDGLVKRLADSGAVAVYGEWTDITINPLIRLESGNPRSNLLEGKQWASEGMQRGGKERS